LRVNGARDGEVWSMARFRMALLSFASVGKEIFDVQNDAKILSATMENPVETIERDCMDAALTDCGDRRHHRIERQVEITLER
jgi:hypothetical protein